VRGSWTFMESLPRSPGGSLWPAATGPQAAIIGATAWAFTGGRLRPVMVRSPSAGHRPTGPATTAAVLVVGAASSGAAAWLVLAGHRAAGGVLALLAAVALILRPRAPDVRRREQAVFARRVLHRVFEAAVLASVAWVERTGSIRVAILALVCLASSY